MDKKIYAGLGLLAVTALFMVGWLIYFIGTVRSPFRGKPESVATQSAEIGNEFPEASMTALAAALTVNFGGSKTTAEKTATYSATLKTPATALGLLEIIDAANNLKVAYNQQPDGIFVKSIKGITNQRDQLWLFYYNGRPAVVTADKQPLQAGDYIEFRYGPVPSP